MTLSEMGTRYEKRRMKRKQVMTENVQGPLKPLRTIMTTDTVAVMSRSNWKGKDNILDFKVNKNPFYKLGSTISNGREALS